MVLLRSLWSIIYGLTLTEVGIKALDRGLPDEARGFDGLQTIRACVVVESDDRIHTDVVDKRSFSQSEYHVC